MTTSTPTPPAPTPFTTWRQRSTGYHANGAAVLPCSDIYGKCNPSNPGDSAWFQDHGPGIIVLAKTVSGVGTRLLPSEGDCLGDYIWLKHDQTGASLGHYFVVGIVERDGATQGRIPNKMLPVAVFK